MCCHVHIITMINQWRKKKYGWVLKIELRYIYISKLKMIKVSTRHYRNMNMQKQTHVLQRYQITILTNWVTFTCKCGDIFDIWFNFCKPISAYINAACSTPTFHIADDKHSSKLCELQFTNIIITI